jgi:ubiquinone/menaquinone biosynthesis C-methylase UbiE
MTDIPLSDHHLADVNRFFAVDAVEQPEQFVRFLEEAKALPAIRVSKAEMLERLQPERAATALDVGCGYGADVIELAKRLKPDGRATGIDISETMIAEANRRAAGTGLSVTFRAGDALALPFEDNAFDICRTETVLQHLGDPETAVAEMARVTRSGGRIAALEFDLGTLFLDHPDTELTETIWTSYLGETVQPSMGRQLLRLFVRAGLNDVASAPRVITSNPSFFRLVTGHHVDQLCAHGVITSDQAAGWWAAMEDAAARGYHTGGATAFLVSGTVR